MNLRRLIEAAIAAVGIALVLAALAAGQSWWDRHFMPIFAIKRSTLVAAEIAVRGLLGLIGALLLVVLRRPIAAALYRAGIGGALRIALAVVLALGTGELMLRAHPPFPHYAHPLSPDPPPHPDPRLACE